MPAGLWNSRLLRGEKRRKARGPLEEERPTPAGWGGRQATSHLLTSLPRKEAPPTPHGCGPEKRSVLARNDVTREPFPSHPASRRSPAPFIRTSIISQQFSWPSIHSGHPSAPSLLPPSSHPFTRQIQASTVPDCLHRQKWVREERLEPGSVTASCEFTVADSEAFSCVRSNKGSTVFAGLSRGLNEKTCGRATNPTCLHHHTPTSSPEMQRCSSTGGVWHPLFTAFSDEADLKSASAGFSNTTAFRR